MNQDEVWERERALAARLNQSSDAVAVDFRRRVDAAQATSTAVAACWEELEVRTAGREKRLKSKAGAIEFAVFTVGALLNWWLHEGKGVEFNWGTALIGAACFSYGVRAIDGLIDDLNLARVTRDQRTFLFHWLQSGADANDFWALKTLAQERAAHAETYANTDEWRGAGTKHDAKEAELWLGIRQTLLYRSSGEYWSGLESPAINLE